MTDAEIAELDYTKDGFQTLYGRVLNFIHYDIDSSQLKSELVSYAEKIGKTEVALSIPANHINVEGSIAYCLNRGANLEQKSIDKVNAFLEKQSITVESQTPDWEYLPDTPQSKHTRAYVSCYSRIDNAKTRVLKGKLDPRELAIEVRKIMSNYGLGKTAVTKQLVEHYTQSLTEAVANPMIKDWVKPLSTILDTLQLMLSNRASIKAGARGAKARKLSRTVDQVDRKGEKAATKVKYKDEDVQYGIRSVDPTNIVGAEAVAVFNAKNRHCEIYRAKDGSRLSVQGAKIINFDEKTSLGKTIRTPEKDLPMWTRATTVRRLEVLINSVNGKTWEVTGKLNRNTIIIKVL
jgi:hypothetical protein